MILTNESESSSTLYTWLKSGVSLNTFVHVSHAYNHASTTSSFSFSLSILTMFVSLYDRINFKIYTLVLTVVVAVVVVEVDVDLQNLKTNHHSSQCTDNNYHRNNNFRAKNDCYLTLQLSWWCRGLPLPLLYSFNLDLDTRKIVN